MLFHIKLFKIIILNILRKQIEQQKQLNLSQYLHPFLEDGTLIIFFFIFISLINLKSLINDKEISKIISPQHTVLTRYYVFTN